MSAEDMVVSAVLPREDVENWPAWKRQRLEFDAEVRSPLQATGSDPHDIVPLSQDSQAIAPLPLLGDAFLPAPQDSEPCGASEESGTLGTTPSANDRAEDGLTRHLMQGLIARSAVGPQLDEAAGNIPDEAVRIAAAPAGTLQSLSISKSRLSEHLRCFGQLQRQFILASTCCCNARRGDFDNGSPCAACGDASLLLLFDQHAVDERIRVEGLTRQLERDLSEGRVLRCCAQAERSTLHVAEGEACTLLERSGAFFRWQFDFRVHDIRATGAEVTLRSVPVILGEALSAADFLEFVRLVATRGPTAPEGLLVPPAVQRILSSVACRGAVKFGDPLSQERCAGQLDRLLRDTELPFQCAHGRPTVGTLLRMDSARAWKMRALAAASL
jgi:DNA mismatch repair ATPase MutL